MLLCQQTHKALLYYQLVTAEPLFIHKTNDCMHQTGPDPRRKHNVLPSVTTHSLLSKCYNSVTVY